MSTHEEMTEELSERASAFVLGSLPADEAHAYREHVERCATCRTEVAELSALYGDQDSQQTLVIYCQTGSRAAVDWLVLTGLGYDDVRLYDGSWAQWGADERYPTE